MFTIVDVFSFLFFLKIISKACLLGSCFKAGNFLARPRPGKLPRRKGSREGREKRGTHAEIGTMVDIYNSRCVLSTMQSFMG